MKSVITCDREGRIETFNDGAQEIFGYTADEVVGKKRVSLFSPGPVVLEHVPKWLAKADDEGAFETDTVFVKKDGSRFPAHIRITPTKRGYCGVTEPLPQTELARAMPRISLSTRMFIPLIITRAPFLTATIVPVLVGAAIVPSIVMATAPSTFAFDALKLALVMIAAIALHVAANVWNDAFDWISGADKENNDYFLPFSGGSRAIELGLVRVPTLFVIGLVAFLIAAVCGGVLAMAAGPTLLIIGAAGAACAFFYTAPPIRLAARRGLGEIAVGLCFGPLMTAGVGVAMTSSFAWSMALVGVPVGLLVTAILWVNEIPDAPSDKRAGKNHAVVTLGAARARFVYVALVVGAAIAVPALVIAEVVPPPSLIALFTLPLMARAAHIVVKQYADRTLIDACRATIQLHLIFGVLFAAGIFMGPLLR